jgi:SAM-dependent methyltransferase
MLDRLDVPQEMHRNDPRMAAVGYEKSAVTLMDLALSRVGLENLEDVDILDVGCGVRFTQAIINCKIPIGSYTGVEVDKSLINFLNERVATFDERFKFLHWNVHNAMFNREGIDICDYENLPVDATFDLIWLFSVFTHLEPKDARAMLQILRRHIRPKGKLFFSAFIDNNLSGFEDRVKETPLFKAYYGRAYMESLIEGTGWTVEGFFDKDESRYIQHHFVCAPR